MAEWRAVARHFPAVRSYIRHRRWVRRGDVVAYAPNLRAEAFATDEVGFRLSAGRGIAACLAEGRFGVVLGSSHVFGFGLASDAETLPARLGEMLGLPMANISFPEADTRTLHAVLTNLVARGARPAVAVLLTGGDFTRHAYSGQADPVFGMANVEDADPRGGDGTASLAAALAFSRLWTQASVDLARRAGVPLVLGDDVTFMDKPAPDAIERACQLGTSGSAAQLRRFAHQARHGRDFYAMRRALAGELAVPLLGPAPEAMSYIDEFHYRAEAIERFAQALAPGILDALRGRA